jgi:ribosomal protein S6
MPLYQQIVVCLPGFSKDGLASLFRNHTRLVQKLGGTVRGLEHNGIRPLPEKAKRKYATREGDRYFWEARYVSTYFDISPKALPEVARFLRTEDGILRFDTLKRETANTRVASKNYKNPFAPKPESEKAGQYD